MCDRLRRQLPAGSLQGRRTHRDGDGLGSGGQGHVVREQRAAEEECMQGEGETGLFIKFDKGKIDFLYSLRP